MSTKVRRRARRLFAAISVIALSVLAAAVPVRASTTVTIRSFSDLLTQCLASRTQDTSGVEYVLDLSDAPGKVLDLTDSQVQDIIVQVGSLTFGSSTNPFRGTFDGRGYTIKGLNYERDLFKPAPDTGLFAWTDGAVIKNVNFEDAYVGADYRGGVIAGYAKDTRFEHIRLTNCTSSVTPANNAVSLITNAGLAGGMVAGEAERCSFYNVEVAGGSVVNNSTAAVSGLGGEGLYLGAIVGCDKGSTIEYCRVVPLRSRAQDGSVSYAYPRVHNKYDIAVGAVAGQAVYAGGVAGSVGYGSRVIDCFSTADVYTYAATYVSVGAGNVGYAGGIAARSDGDAEVLRCHYAGNLHTYLYNALLVIPIIQKNVYLGGIVEQDHGALSIRDSYYKPSVSAVLDPGTDKDIPSIWDKDHGKVYAGASFGPQEDGPFADRSFWEQAGFDFEGGIERVTGSLSGAPHINKWIMDYDLGIPVHGESVKTTIDFPGAGTATIGPADLVATSSPQTTSDAYDFAVQGFVPADLDIELTADTASAGAAPGGQVFDPANGGFRFLGWYRVRDVDENRIDPDPSVMEALLRRADPAGPVAVSEIHVAENRGPGDDAGFRDNDLFIAHFRANVLYHGVAGGIVDPATGLPRDPAEADWYRSGQALSAAAEPAADRAAAGGPVSDSATFLGWTSRPSAEAGVPGYRAVTSSELIAMKRDGVFYVAGDPVSEPMDLYPVYSDYSANIKAHVEGWEYDAAGEAIAYDPSEPPCDVRQGVARAHVGATTVDGSERYKVSLEHLGAGGALPDGYRFRGWYTEAADGTEVRISDREEFILPADLDLTREVVFTARFEYRVDYYAKAFGEHGTFPDSELVVSKWEPYRAVPVQIEGPVFSAERVVHWGLSHVEHGGADGAGDAFAGQVVAPIKLYSHNVRDKVNFSIMLDTDFPDSGTLGLTGHTTNWFDMSFEADPGYKFLFWSLQNGNQKSGNRWSYVKNPADTGYLGLDTSGYYYRGRAYVVAEARFHMPDDATVDTVYRRYDERVLLDAPAHHDYPWPFYKENAPGLVNETDPYDGSPSEISSANVDSGASPSAASMARDGYHFIGWIDGTAGSETERGGEVWNKIYNAGEPFCTSEISRALSYIVLDSDRVSAPMDLYPVYARYDYAATTNVALAGVPGGAGVNVPADPSVAFTEAGGGRRDLVLAADTATAVTPGGDPYRLVGWDVYRNGAKVETIAAAAGGSPELSYTVEAGPSYLFVALYEPLVVVYHVGDADARVVTRNRGDRLGDPPVEAPAFDFAQVDAAAGAPAVFTGWTEAAPAGPFAIDADGSVAKVNRSTRVDRSMELYAVYRPCGASVDSNIDGALAAQGTDPATVRSIERGPHGRLSIAARSVPGYEFRGWYRDFDQSAGTGERITAADVWALGANVFDETVYTAVYEAVYDVRYHGVDGSVLFTAHAKEGDPRSFVEQGAAPDGSTVYTFIDSEALLAINSQLSAAAGGCRELFDNWCRIVDGAVVPCDDAFYRTVVSSDIDLYPMTWAASVSDSRGAPFNDGVLAALDLSKVGSVTEAPVRLYFKQGYLQPSLTVHVERRAYDGGTAPRATPAEGVRVDVFEAPLIDAARVGSEPTDAAGDAVFEFDGRISITKRADDARAAGAAFTIAVMDRSTGAVRTVVVRMGDAPDATGSYVGTAEMVLPFGSYELYEDAWNWRWSCTGSAGGPSVSLDVSGPAALSAEFTNSYAGSEWLSGENSLANVFASHTKGGLV